MADEEFIRRLNDYHIELLSMTRLVAHLLDVAIDLPGEEWHKSGCHLMKTQLVEKAEQLPFPGGQS